MKELIDAFLRMLQVLNGCWSAVLISVIIMAGLIYLLFKLFLENRKLFKENVEMSGELSAARSFKDNASKILKLAKDMKGLNNVQ